MKKETFTISIEVHGIKASVELDHEDVTVEEALDAFKGVMVGVGFAESCIDKYLKD